MSEPTHFVIDKFTQAKRLQSQKPPITALGKDFIGQENAGERLVQFNKQIKEDPKSRHRFSFHAKSWQRETSNIVPDDISNRPFENRTHSPNGISAVKKLEIKENARETIQDYSSQKRPRSPSQPLNERKRELESNSNWSANQKMESKTVQQSKAQILNVQSGEEDWRGPAKPPKHSPLFDPDLGSPLTGSLTATRVYDPKAQIMNVQGAEEYWRLPAKPPKHSSLFDPDRGSPLTSSLTATRVYDPRSHIFRSKAYDPKPGVLSAPDSLYIRPTAGHNRVSSSFGFDSERYHDCQPPGGFLPYNSSDERNPSFLLQPETRPVNQEQPIARYWYNKSADKSPCIGRIQHHLAVLARPNALRQLFYYTRALTCIQPFLNAGEHTDKFLSLIDNNIGPVTAKRRVQGAWKASSDFDILLVWFRILRDAPSHSVELAEEIWISIGTGFPQLFIVKRQDYTQQSSKTALVRASCLAFSTLADTFSNTENAYLPEDFVICGQVWCQQYHPDGFFDEDCPGQEDIRSTIQALNCNQTSEIRSSTSVFGRTLLFGAGDAVRGIYDTTTEAFKTYWNCSSRLMHDNFSCNKLASLFIKSWLLYAVIPVAAALPAERNQSTSRANSYTSSGPLSLTQASGSVIAPIRLSVEDILFMALAVISPVGFHIFGKRTGNQLLATGAAMVPANIVHLMTWEDGSIGTIGRLSTLFLALLSTGAFACHIFHEFPHMGSGHGIAIFFSTVGLVWLCPRGSSSGALIGGQTDSPTQYILPCLAASLVCWYRIAPHTEPYSRPRPREQAPILPL